MKNRRDNYFFSDVKCMIGILSVLTCCSCSTIRLKDREGKDRWLDETQFGQLEGRYANGIIDSTSDYSNRTLFGNFETDTVNAGIEKVVQIAQLDAKRLELSLYSSDHLLSSTTLKGRFKRGYFKVRRRCKTNFIAGPILWVIAEDFQYIGLTNENSLVVLNSGGSGLLLFVVVPVFAGGGGNFWNEYKRIQ